MIFFGKLCIRSGSLPWQNIKAPTLRQKLGKIQDLKEAVSITSLRKICPEVFHDLVLYPRGLKYGEAKQKVQTKMSLYFSRTKT